MGMVRGVRTTAYSLVIVAIAPLFTGSCTAEPARQPAEITADFAANQLDYDELHALIIEDADEAFDPEEASDSDSGCRTIGPRRIDGYWKQRGGWSEPGPPDPVPLEEVLRAVDLDRDRYDSYLAALASAQASSLRRCPDQERTEIVVASTGIGISGCITTVEINGNGEIPQPAPSHSTSEIVPLDDGWYLSHYCT